GGDCASRSNHRLRRRSRRRLQDAWALPRRPSEMTDRDNGKLFTDATRAGLLVLAFAVAAVIAVVGLAVGEWSLTIVGLALAVALAGSLAGSPPLTQTRGPQ